MVMTLNRPMPAVPTRSRHDELDLYSPRSAQVAGTLSVAPVIFPADSAIPGRPNATLKRLVSAQIIGTPDGYFVSSGEVDEDGYGVTPGEASEDFLVSLYDRCVSLARHEPSLSDHDRRVLATLREVLGPLA